MTEWWGGSVEGRVRAAPTAERRWRVRGGEKRRSVEERGSAPTDGGMVGRGPRRSRERGSAPKDDEWWGGVRGSRERGSAPTDERAGGEPRGGPRGSGKRGSVEERGSAPPGRRNSGEGAALFNAKYHAPANCIGGRLVNASGQPHSRVQSRAAKLPRI
ncbi:hypothetical protein niasHT_022868 [Heterodera trifolii]|uniref:Uncharacterized protein n=1 Tax=Heterodera trifolii TaxID=157864 RepID=A0ABD2KM66_9BILA